MDIIGNWFQKQFKKAKNLYTKMQKERAELKRTLEWAKEYKKEMIQKRSMLISVAEQEPTVIQEWIVSEGHDLRNFVRVQDPKSIGITTKHYDEMIEGNFALTPIGFIKYANKKKESWQKNRGGRI